MTARWEGLHDRGFRTGGWEEDGNGLGCITVIKYSNMVVFSVCVKQAGHAGGVFPHQSGMGLVCLLYSPLFCTFVLTHASLPLSVLFPLTSSPTFPLCSPLLLSTSIFNSYDRSCLLFHLLILFHPWSFAGFSMLLNAHASINAQIYVIWGPQNYSNEALNDVWMHPPCPQHKHLSEWCMLLCCIF